jgi:hypothetical protein
VKVATGCTLAALMPSSLVWFVEVDNASACTSRSRLHRLQHISQHEDAAGFMSAVTATLPVSFMKVEMQ